MKDFKLVNANGDTLVSRAYDVGNGMFIVGRKIEEGKIDCNTFPLTQRFIEDVYNLKFAEMSEHDK